MNSLSAKQRVVEAKPAFKVVKLRSTDRSLKAGNGLESRLTPKRVSME